MRNLRGSESGFTMVEVTLAAALSGFCILAISQLVALQKKSTEFYRARADLTLLMNQLSKYVATPASCKATFKPGETIKIAANDPINKNKELYNPATGALIAKRDGVFGSLRIDDVVFDPISQETASATATETKVLANIRLSVSMLSKDANQVFPIGGFHDVIPVVFTINSANPPVIQSCIAGSSAIGGNSLPNCINAVMVVSTDGLGTLTCKPII